MKHFETLTAAEAYLDSLLHFGIKLGLEQTRELLKRVGNPEQNLHFLHIAGTNGKGSVGAMLERALREGGKKRTGFYSSPHLLSVTERIRIDGQAISNLEFAELTNIVAEAVESMRQSECGAPTYFEATTAMALLAFSRAKCDFVIWETGMGGRLDSTNVVTPDVAIIPSIALDHMKYLGDTIEKIAGEKAGIIKPGIPVVVGALPPEAAQVCRSRAEALAAPYYEAQLEFPLKAVTNTWQRNVADGVFRQEFVLGKTRVALPLPGAMQRRNAALVLTVLRLLCGKDGNLDFAALVVALRHCSWPGRAQVLGDGRTMLDGGHNPHGIAALLETLHELYPQRKFDWIFGAFADKDSTRELALLAPLVRRFYAVEFAEGTRMSRSAEDLCKAAQAAGITEVFAAHSLSAALKASENSEQEIPDGVNRVIAGSLYLAGEALMLLADRNTVLNL